MLRRKILQAVFAAICILCTVGVVLSSASSAEYTLKIAFLGSPEDEDYDGSLVFKDYVESRTNGRVQVKIYPSGQFCSNERECIEGLQSGILEIHMTTIGGLGNLFGPGQVLDLPYVFRDDRVAECVLDGPFADQIRAAVLDAGLNMRLMTISNTGGWRNFATANKQIRRPEDLKGQKIRTTPSEVQQILVKQLGGNPTPVAWSEVYTALATGAVEGTKNGIQDIVGMKFHEHLKYITLDGHAYMGALWWFSESAWKNLPEDIRRVVYDGFQHLKTVTRALPIRRQIDSYEVFKEAGGSIYVPEPEEKRMFQQATRGVRKWFVDKYGREWLDKLEKAVKDCETSIGQEFDMINK